MLRQALLSKQLGAGPNGQQYERLNGCQIVWLLSLWGSQRR